MACARFPYLTYLSEVEDIKIYELHTSYCRYSNSRFDVTGFPVIISSRMMPKLYISSFSKFAALHFKYCIRQLTFFYKIKLRLMKMMKHTFHPGGFLNFPREIKEKHYCLEKPGSNILTLIYFSELPF